MRNILRNIVLSLAGTVILLSLVTPADAIDHPVEPFQKAKAMALTEGILSETYGKMYILVIKGWGSIIYEPTRPGISLNKGTPSQNVVVDYRGWVTDTPLFVRKPGLNQK